MTVDLLPCPFCRSSGDSLSIEKFINAAGYFVKCSICLTTGPDPVRVLLGHTKSGAISAWNTRAAPDILRQHAELWCEYARGLPGQNPESVAERVNIARGLDLAADILNRKDLNDDIE